jgi:hypothetical protein
MAELDELKFLAGEGGWWLLESFMFGAWKFGGLHAVLEREILIEMED